MMHPFYTIGHSTRSIGEFVDLLTPQRIRLVVDVRTIPRSRTNPQYNAEELAKDLDMQIAQVEARNKVLESEIARRQGKGPAVKCVPESKK